MDADFKPAEHVYMINVANVGQTPVTVSQVYVWYARGWKFAFPNLRGEKQLPCTLEPGEGANWWVDYEALRKALRQSGHRGKVRIKLEATDATGRSYDARAQIILNAPLWRRFFGL